MTQTKKQGRLRRRLYALTAALALVVSLFSGIPGRKVAEAAGVGTTISNASFEDNIWSGDSSWSPYIEEDDWTNSNISVKTYGGSDNLAKGPSDETSGNYVDCWSSEQYRDFTFTKTISLKAGSYTFNVSGSGSNAGYQISVGDTYGDNAYPTAWGEWNTASVEYTTDVDVDSITLKIAGWTTAESGGNLIIDNVTFDYTPIYPATVANSPYQKDTNADLVTVTVGAAEDDIDSVKIGDDTKTKGTDYTISTTTSGTVIAFTKTCLESLASTEHTGTIVYKANKAAKNTSFKFTVSDKPDHSIVVNVDKFNSNDAGADPITMTVDCTSDKIASVSVVSTALTKDTDYTLAASTDEKSTIITFTTTYLTSLDLGEYTATVAFSDNADSRTGTFTVSELPVGLQNGSFDTDLSYWDYSPVNEYFGYKGSENGHNGVLNMYITGGADADYVSQTFIADATGTYVISYDVIGDNNAKGDTGFKIYVNNVEVGTVSTTGYAWSTNTTDEFELTEGQVVKLEIKGQYSKWFALDNIKIKDPNEEEELPVGLQNGDFESGKYWSITNRESDNADEKNEPFKLTSEQGGTNTSQFLNIWTEDTTKEYSISQTFKAEESGQYVINYKYLGSEGACGFDIYVNDTKVETLSGKGWTGNGVWTEKTTKTAFELKKDAVVTFAIKGKAVSNSAYMKLDDIKIIPYEVDENARVFDIDKTIATGDMVDTDLYVEKLDLAKGFITGADISSYASIVASGATYKNAKGEPLSDAKFFELLAESGVNYVRIRVWVDPTDGNGNGYGGGNCDLATAKKLGKLATDAGMKVLIDFHYSDFWTDPGKQTTPKAWQGLTLDEKAQTLKEWTTKSLTDIINAGVNVGMVQIGNETTTGFCGETNMTNMCKLFAAGSEGVRAVEKAKYDGKPTIMMAIHLTNPDKIDFSGFAAKLKENNVVYDVFATSFYPYWHGTLDNLYTKLAAVADEYDKYVMVAETSYVRTLEDGDGWENTETQSKKDNGDVFPYDISEQGQVLHIRNVINTLTSIPDNKGIGVFWWEPAWIPVQNWADAEDQDKVLAENKALWEEYGSGWATSAASDYDKNVGQWYGGSAVDNESWFDFDGKALESLKVYNMVRFGTNSEDYLIDVIDTEYSFVEGQEYSFPTEVDALYASGETYKVGVTWDQEQIEAAAASGYGSYEIDGIVTYNEEEYDVICKLTIKPVNLLVNGSFEDGKGKGWDFDLTHTTAGTNEKADGVKEEDSHDGKYTFHFYSTTDQSFTVTQKVTLEPGAYAFNGYFQGLAGVEGEIFVQVGDDEYAALYVLNGWVDWQNPEVDRIFITEETEVTVGFTCSYSAGAWGTCDDFTLYRMGDIVTISFDSNGHGTAPDPITVLEGEKVNQPADPSAEGFIFTGWCIDKVCTEWFDFNRPIIADNADITLYARWVKNPEKSYYQDGKSEGNIGSLSWILGDGDLHSTYHSTVNDAETINHFKGVDIARYLNDADMSAENGFEAAADAVARGLAPSSAGFTPFAALGGSSLRAKAGSLKLTIFSSYLETLDPGYYLLRIVFDDGEVYTMLTINAKAADDEVEPDDNKAADADVKPADDSASKDTAPKTADETPIEAAMLILLISAAGLSYILGLKRKRS